MLATLIQLVVYLVVVGLVLWLLTWLIDYIPVPDPFNRVAKIVIMIVGVLIVCYVLLGLVGDTPRLGRL
jgi:hypothetical protein